MKSEIEEETFQCAFESSESRSVSSEKQQIRDTEIAAVENADRLCFSVEVLHFVI